MRVAAVTFGENRDPETMTVVMSADEAAIVAWLLDNLSPNDINEFAVAQPGHGISHMFNSFFENGVMDQPNLTAYAPHRALLVVKSEQRKEWFKGQPIRNERVDPA